MAKKTQSDTDTPSAGRGTRAAADAENVFLAPVATRSTLQDGVYRQLREALMSGRFEPGQVLTIASLAATFETSHMPVREALRRLAAENALVVLASGSAQVPHVSRSGLDDLCLARVALESLAGKLASERCTEAQRRDITRRMQAHEEAASERDAQHMLRMNQEFHFAVYSACDSPVLVQLIQTLWLRFGPYMRMLSRHLEPLIASGEYQHSSHHRDLVAALERGDARAAGDAVQADIEASQSLLRRLCREMA